jgi:hypothetical protein
MTPREFILKWREHALTERSAAQQHFIDLCRLVDHPAPAEVDTRGDTFCFEKGTTKAGGGHGFADVWKRGHFAWEYKKRKRSLDEAMAQLANYASALDNPPIHVACDTITFRIATRFTNTVATSMEFPLEELMQGDRLDLLRAVFHDPEKLRPKVTRASLTEEAAKKFQTISDALQSRNPDREAVAHFVNQLVFCFFANSVKLLPDGLLVKLLDTALKRPHRAKQYFDKLFAEMEKGGEFDLTEIRWFNGGLFDGRRALRLDHVELGLLRALHSFRWDLIDPTIFGTLFERFLDPDKRAQIGAHYTDPARIMQIVEPVIVRPLAAEWQEARARIEALMRPLLDRSGRAPAGKAREQASAIRDAYIDRLCAVRVLDPACGSGNFLYLALQAVKDLEWKAILECEALDLGRPPPRVGPRILRGIEINPLAAELARTVIWIGDIQWSIRNGLARNADPILEDLDTIECRDALVMRVLPSPLAGEGGSRSEPGEGALGSRDHPSSARLRRAPAPAGGEGGSLFVEAEWPEAEFIVGNPPFLGGKKLRRDLGDETVDTLFEVFDGAVPAEADLVCYWFHKAWRQVSSGRARRAGLVSTNSIRGGANRAVLEPIAEAGAFIEAWSDEPWVIEGASVRVSLTCFGERRACDGLRLDGVEVARINADLSAAAADVTRARRLRENANAAFQGPVLVGEFEIPSQIARSLLLEPLNPNGRPNSDVLFPFANGRDIAQISREFWVVDFRDRNEIDASYYQMPFERIKGVVRPQREKNRRERRKEFWWHHGDKVPKMIAKTSDLKRFIFTPRVSAHRIFVWFESCTLPDSRLVCIARDDETTFGILHSRLHEKWSTMTGGWHGVGNDPQYTPTKSFETFPFPEGLTPNIPAADYAADPRAIRIAGAARRLDELRNNWLHPADLGAWQPEIVPTAAPGEEPRKYPDRFIPKDAEAALKLKKRTLTNLYNQRPAWLAAAHEALDRAVAAAYGWPEDIAADEALARLLALNLERAAKQAPA